MVEIKGKQFTSVKRSSVMGGSFAASDVSKRPTRPEEHDFKNSSSTEIEYWGSRNTRPQELIEAAEGNDLLRSSLWFITRAIYSGGLNYGFWEGNEFIPQRIDRVDNFIKNSKIHLFAIKCLYNIKYFWITFPEIILTKDRSEIAILHTLDSSFCRWDKHKTSAKRWPLKCFVDANWELNSSGPGRYTMEVDVLDDFCGGIEWLRSQNGHKYVLPNMQLPSIGSRYYPDPIWSSLLKTKWLEYANKIPIMKDAYLENGAHLKYIIHVPRSWWSWKYEDFDSLGEAERKEIIDKEHTEFDNYVTGAKNAGKAILATYNDDPEISKSGWAKWEIKQIDSDMGKLLGENSTLESSQQIYTALELDGTLRGITPGGELRGSGSDKKQAYNIMMALTKPEQDIVTGILKFVSEYNGYTVDGKVIDWTFKNRLIADLKDTSPTDRTSENAN